MAHAPLIIVSGPSGSGKSTLIKGVIARWPDRLHLAVSATTRDPRPGE
jgi:guanylate kinase